MQRSDVFSPVPHAPSALRPRPQSKKRRAVTPREIERLVDEARTLVPMFARRYLGRGVAFEDLVGAGNLGVVEAAYRFDPKRGVKFGSYAGWWIRKSIANALATAASVVAVPRYSFERRRRVIDAIESGRPSGERDLGLKDVAAGLGLSSRQVEQALSFSIGVVSLDTPLVRDEGRNLGEKLAGPAEEGPEALVMDAERARAAREALRVLSTRQRLVIMLRYGVGGNGEEAASLTDVGRVMGLSRERVRQIEGEALNTVRLKLARDAKRPRRR